MDTNETKILKDMENNENKSMDEKVHYEIKFVETADGYRLEASGDKEALKRLGIGPNMVGRKRRGGHGRSRGQGPRHARRMGPRQRRRAAIMARRRFGMPHQEWFGHGAPEWAEFANEPRRRPCGPRGRHGASGPDPANDKDMPDYTEQTKDW